MCLSEYSVLELPQLNIICHIHVCTLPFKYPFLPGPREQGGDPGPGRGRWVRAGQQHRADRQPEAVAGAGHAAELHDEGQAPEDTHRLRGRRLALGEFHLTEMS